MAVHQSESSAPRDATDDSDETEKGKSNEKIQKRVEKEAERWSSMEPQEALEEPLVDLRVYLNDDGTLREFVLLLEEHSPTVELLVVEGVVRGYSDESGQHTASVRNEDILEALLEKCTENFRSNPY